MSPRELVVLGGYGLLLSLHAALLCSRWRPSWSLLAARARALATAWRVKGPAGEEREAARRLFQERRLRLARRVHGALAAFLVLTSANRIVGALAGSVRALTFGQDVVVLAAGAAVALVTSRRDLLRAGTLDAWYSLLMAAEVLMPLWAGARCWSCSRPSTWHCA